MLIAQVDFLMEELQSSQLALVAACDSMVTMRRRIVTLEGYLARPEADSDATNCTDVLSWAVLRWRSSAQISAALGSVDS